MTLPWTLPDWLPSWVPIVVLVPTLLWLLAFLFLPFSVLGTKGRLEAIEARLDELQGEIRSLALRMPEAVTSRAYGPHTYDEVYAAPPPRAEPAPPIPLRPPIPPAGGADWAARDPGGARDPGAAREATPRRRVSDGRAEPRLDWPER